jgi:hypothetical protein
VVANEYEVRLRIIHLTRQAAERNFKLVRGAWGETGWSPSQHALGSFSRCEDREIATCQPGYSTREDARLVERLARCL